jgi:cytoskeletal protein CcmA (bactofilin family)
LAEANEGVQMQGAEKQLSNLTAQKSSASPSGPSGYFDAWLKELGPVFELDEPAPAVQTPAHTTHHSRPSDLQFEGTLRVDCFVKGRLRSLTGTLVVSETAQVEAEISVGVAIIEGQLVGDIHATERVEIAGHARVIGNIETPSLSIHPEAVFEGHCNFPPRVKAENNNSKLARTNPASTIAQPARDEEDELVARLVAVAR